MKDLVFEKLKLGEIEKCYSTLGLEIGGKPYLFYGGEGNGSMRVFSGENFENCDIIWEGGGTMVAIGVGTGVGTAVGTGIGVWLFICRYCALA